jgi:hypothetical protein
MDFQFATQPKVAKDGKNPMLGLMVQVNYLIYNVVTIRIVFPPKKELFKLDN